MTALYALVAVVLCGAMLAAVYAAGGRCAARRRNREPDVGHPLDVVLATLAVAGLAAFSALLAWRLSEVLTQPVQ